MMQLSQWLGSKQLTFWARHCNEREISLGLQGAEFDKSDNTGYTRQLKQLLLNSSCSGGAYELFEVRIPALVLSVANIEQAFTDICNKVQERDCRYLRLMNYTSGGGVNLQTPTTQELNTNVYGEYVHGKEPPPLELIPDPENLGHIVEGVITHHCLAMQTLVRLHPDGIDNLSAQTQENIKKLQAAGQVVFEVHPIKPPQDQQVEADIDLA